MRIDSDEQVAQGGVAGDFAERGAFLARKAKPSALGLGEELGVSLNGGDVVTAGKQGHGDEHQQRPTRIGAVGTARVGEVRLSARSICVPTRICVEFPTDSVHGTGRASQRIPTPIQGGTQIPEEDKFFLRNWPKENLALVLEKGNGRIGTEQFVVCRDHRTPTTPQTAPIDKRYLQPQQQQPFRNLNEMTVALHQGSSRKARRSRPAPLDSAAGRTRLSGLCKK